jgi:hypothetical protein
VASALPKRIEKWSLTSLQQRLVKTGGRLVKHARYYWLLLAESHLTRQLFGSMYGAADRGAVASGGIAEAVAGKSIQSQEGTEGCLTRPDRKTVLNSFGTRAGTVGTLD